MVHFISWRMAWCMTRKAVNYKPTPTPRLEARGEENKSREITALVHFIYSSHSPFKTNHFVVGCQCAQRILPTQTKYFLELSIIVDFVVNNCLKNRELYMLTDSILTTIQVNLDVNYRQFKDNFCFCSNEMQLCRIWRAKQNWQWPQVSTGK